MKIIGWTSWNDPRYRRYRDGRHEKSEVDAIKFIIANELRKNGYKFSGTYHQSGDFGVPVFDTGEVFQCSQRCWGGIMAEAYPDEIDNSDGFGYAEWSWTVSGNADKMVLPNMKA